MSSSTNTVAAEAAPESLRPGSLVRRAVLGLVGLSLGIVAAAWLLHASIEPAASARASDVEAVTETPNGAGHFAIVRKQ